MSEFEVNVSTLEFADWEHITQTESDLGRPISISSWFGKTFFRYDNSVNKLYARNFNIFEQLFRWCFGYGKEYNKDSLWSFAKSRRWVQSNEPCPAGTLFRQKMAEKFTEFCDKRNYLFNFSSPQVSQKQYNTDQLIELFENGLDVNLCMKRFSTFTALFAAVRRSDEKLVKYLIEKGANVNNIDLAERERFLGAKTPLAYAIVLHMLYEQANYGIVSLLIEKGADVNAKNEENLTALHFAVGGTKWKNEYDASQFVVKALGMIHISNFVKVSVLDFVKVNPQVVTSLVAKGADINACTQAGATALSIAAQKKDIETVKLLLSLKADVNAGALYSYAAGFVSTFPLFIAIKNYDSNMVELLLHHEAKLEMIRDEGTSHKKVINAFSVALSGVHTPGWKPSLQILQLLIGKTVDLNVLDGNGQTPLHYAVENNFVEAAELLMKHGSKFDIPNSAGKTAAQLAETPEMKKLFGAL